MPYLGQFAMEVVKEKETNLGAMPPELISQMIGCDCIQDVRYILKA
jgi:hypothetical protein